MKLGDAVILLVNVLFFMLCMSCRFIFLSKVFPAIDFTSKWEKSTKLHAHPTYDLNALEKTQTCFCMLLLSSAASIFH